MGVEYSRPLSSSLGSRSPSAQIKGGRHHTAQQRELGFIQSVRPHPELKRSEADQEYHHLLLAA